MKCPHCTTSFHDSWQSHFIGEQPSDHHFFVVHWLICPECKKTVLKLGELNPGHVILKETVLHPRTSARPPVSPDVPTAYAEDYSEAALILANSPKASAALSRRVLQHVLREVLMVKPSNLANEIEQALPTLPAHLQHLDAIRNVGNFSAHPTKNTSTTEIIDVEPEEAEWLLDILDELFEFLFIRPAVVQRKKDVLNAKLKAAGKPEMT